MTKAKDITGIRFGRLVAVRPTEKRMSNNIIWECICDCGNTSFVDTGSLGTGNANSCGCLREEKSRANIRAYNAANKLPLGEASRNQLYRNYRGGAKGRGLLFTITKDEFSSLTSQPCHYCGLPPYHTFNTKGLNGNYTYTGLDRVDNSLGYTLENVVPCCGVCNRMKTTYTEEQFIANIERIHIHLKSLRITNE
jgi:hypothetical protein